MVVSSDTSFINTVKERCRVCYTCVRECPAKAIRISDGQAEVIPQRCIACGNCVRVCSQNAKIPQDSLVGVKQLLAGPAPVAACIAPSFPADFPEMDFRQFVGMVRALGFARVTEVAFGADLVAAAYRDLLQYGNPDQSYISSPCPAVISYVEKYAPELIDSLAPIVSPMIAQARVVREIYGAAHKVVFIGPCIAKKCEALSPAVLGDVDDVLTFVELRTMFEQRGLKTEDVTAGDFDPPHPDLGALFPISRGLLQAADVPEDLRAGEVVASDGNKELIEAVKEFSSGALDGRFLDILCCNGCMMGAGMSSTEPLFSRRGRISKYVRERSKSFDRDEWRRYIHRFAKMDLKRRFLANDQRIPVPNKEEIVEVLQRMGKFKPEDELNCGACGYDTCVEHAVAIIKGLAESEMCLPHTIEQLGTTVKDLAVSNEQLANAQEALVQSEKLASMGQLAAGIAHEVNNPLGVVLMFAHLLLEEAAEKNPEIADDLNMIVQQADRCKKIVAGLLHFARQNKVTLQPVDLREIIEKAVKMVNLPANVSYNIDARTDNLVAELDGDQIVQVVINLVTNAVGAMPEGGQINIAIEGDDENIKASFADTGCGIPEENLAKVFEPFFSTKQMGKGTGLGLAVTYGIIKMHRGDIKVESNANADAGPTGATFTITLPRKGRTD